MMDTKKLLGSASRLMLALEENGFAGIWVLQGQHGMPAIDNLSFHLRKWQTLGPAGREMHLTLSVNMDWGTVSYVQHRFFLTFDREGDVWLSGAESVKLGRLSNMELSRSRWEPVGRGTVPTLPELITGMAAKY